MCKTNVMKEQTTINIGVIGNGFRAGALRPLFSEDKRTCLKAVFDPDLKRMEAFTARMNHPDAEHCRTYEEVTANPSIDWILVISPNHQHKAHIVSAFEHGKNVFAEKPLATSIEDCQSIYDAHQKSGKYFATGFVLRYAPLFVKAKEILDSGMIGDIISIDANENLTPSHGSTIMTNWRRFSKFAGSHLLEKCVHDLDLINWFVGALPSRVAAFGGRNLFTPENSSLEKEFINPRTGKSEFHAPRLEEDAKLSPFTCEKDIVDNQVNIFEYRNNVRVMFQATMSNAIPERRMYFSCTKGTMIIELYAGVLKVKRIGGNEPVLLYENTPDLHGGGDRIIMESLYDTMVNGTAPKCSGDEGLTSAVAALAADMSMQKGSIIDIEPIWQALGR
jgi:predicted dehydrogenase